MSDTTLIKIHPQCFVDPHRISAIYQPPLSMHTELIIDGQRVSVEAPLDDVLERLKGYVIVSEASLQSGAG